MVNKKENTTAIISKILRDNLMDLKYKYHLDDINSVIEMLYEIKDETKLTEKDKELLLVGVNHKSELGEI